MEIGQEHRISLPEGFSLGINLTENSFSWKLYSKHNQLLYVHHGVDRIYLNNLMADPSRWVMEWMQNSGINPQHLSQQISRETIAENKARLEREIQEQIAAMAAFGGTNDG